MIWQKNTLEFSWDWGAEKEHHEVQLYTTPSREKKHQLFKLIHSILNRISVTFWDEETHVFASQLGKEQQYSRF